MFGYLLCYNENFSSGVIKLRSNIIERAYDLAKKEKKKRKKRNGEQICLEMISPQSLSILIN